MTRKKSTAGLTEKQEAFAVSFAINGNAAQAYRDSHNVAPDATDSWIYVEAAQLVDHPKIAPRIKELQDAAKKRSEFTVVKAMEELDEARREAKALGAPAAMISATNSKIKLLGMDQPARVDHTSSDGSMTPKEPVPVNAELADALAKKLLGDG